MYDFEAFLVVNRLEVITYYWLIKVATLFCGKRQRLQLETYDRERNDMV